MPPPRSAATAFSLVLLTALRLGAEEAETAPLRIDDLTGFRKVDLGVQPNTS